jgi:regulator of sigma E protease
MEKVDDKRSFSAQPISKRALISFGGVISFWIIAVIIFSIVFATGVPTAISDEENIANSKVQIAAVAFNSPAQLAGLKIGDVIKEYKTQNTQYKIQKVKEIQEFIEKNKGQEITLTIERGKEVFTASLVPRVSPPEGEGAIGVALVRTAIKSYPWWISPWQGILTTGNLTILIIKGLYQAIANAIQGLPTGVELVGPVGIGSLFYQAAKLGVNYFLNLLAMISIYLAIFNILPIPAADGGKLLFLGIEAIRKKPVSEKIEQNITAVSFALLLTLMVFVTIKDIARLF